MKNFKKFLIAAFAAILLVASGAYLVALAKPVKITDPHDPAFNIEKFDSRDYKSADEMAQVFKKFFPLGTPRSYIENILTKSDTTRIPQKESFETKRGVPGLGHGYQYKDVLKDFSAAYLVRYGMPPKKPIFGLTITPGSERTAVSYYDENDRLKLMLVGNELVHMPK